MYPVSCILTLGTAQRNKNMNLSPEYEKDVFVREPMEEPADEELIIEEQVNEPEAD